MRFLSGVITMVFAFGLFTTLFLSPDVRAQPAGISLEDTRADDIVPANLPTFDLETETDPIRAVESVLVNYVINPIFLLSGGIAVIMIMYAAFRIMTTRGEEEGLETAKTTLIWAFAGLGLIIFSYTIVRNLSSIILDLV